MARAKRTARADARRRSRAAQSGAIDDDLESTTGATPTASSRRPAPPPTERASATPTRMGFMEAFRAATRPVNVRADLAALPWIAIHTKALWIPLLITVVSTAAVILTNGGTISLFLFAYFIQTPAIGGVFIAGFLAPRASWLLGAIVGFVAAICYTILLFGFPSTISTGPAPTQSQATEVAVSALVLSPIIGGIFAAGAAWYRRFLRLSSPVRNRSSNEPRKRAGDGRTRTSGTQKAGARR